MSESAEPVAVTVGDHRLLVATEPPPLLASYGAHAELFDDLSRTATQPSGYVFVAVQDTRRSAAWPELVVTQRFAPSTGGFAPGVLLVPATEQLFLGAGTWLAGYEHRTGRWGRSFTDTTDVGFLGWYQHTDVVVMAAELELAAWSSTGDKLWTTFVEPPWTYHVHDTRVHLDLMGTTTTFDLHTGPTTNDSPGSRP